MNKMFFFCLFGFGVFSACRMGGRRHTSSVQDLPGQAGQKKEIIDLDTAMFSLTGGKTVALTDVLSQEWTFEMADKSDWNEIFRDSVTDTRQYPQLTLFTDHSVTLNARRELETGEWQLNKDTRELLLSWKSGGSAKYIVRQIALKQLELEWHRDQGPVLIKLSAEALVHKRPAEDPFYPANNQWRIKPAGAETKDQIRMRIKGCVHFYALFFLDNHQRQETEISFDGLPSCFTWYNGGIGMQAKDKLDKTWIDCFYSGDQAMEGYELLSTQLGRHELKWPEHPTSWVKQTGEVLDQLAAKF